jgi:amino acid transporter
MPLPAWVIAVGRVLNRPLPGTKPRPPRVVVPGRIPKPVIGAALALLLLGTVAFAFVFPDFKLDPWKPLFTWAEAHLCDVGWGGYSQGTIAYLGVIGSGVVLAWVMAIYFWLAGRRLMRLQTNLPGLAQGKRPWFPTPLVEGELAVRDGRRAVWAAVGMGLLCAYMTLGLFPDVARWVLRPPADLKTCVNKAVPAQRP